MGLLWCVEEGSKSRKSNFHIAYNTPFDILFGSELFLPQVPYSFNERALILTPREETEGLSEHLLAGAILKSHQS